jgi:Kdo2-lipid IVA lauroyltransferase/acyltransferase
MTALSDLGRLRRAARSGATATLGWLTVGMLHVLRATSRPHMADLAGWFLRTFGPALREHRIGRANLAAAFPEKSSAEIEAMLSEVWDNLGRVAAEFAHIDRFAVAEPDVPARADIRYTPEAYARFLELRGKAGPALIFAAHLANWELPALIANRYHLDASVLYRPPNIRAAGDAVIAIRQGSMGTLVPTGLDAPLRLARVLEGGGRVAMLVDQNDVNGVEVTFFGRRCKANPLIARLARQIDCPIHGTRVIRLPDRRSFRAEITEAITPARDADGRIDVAGTMQIITSVVEGWIREHPEQWLWVHRRWR